MEIEVRKVDINTNGDYIFINLNKIRCIFIELNHNFDDIFEKTKREGLSTINFYYDGYLHIIEMTDTNISSILKQNREGKLNELLY